MTPGWSSIATAGGSCATLPAFRCRGPCGVPIATPRTRSFRSGPGVERVEEEAQAEVSGRAPGGILVGHRHRRGGRPGADPGDDGWRVTTSWWRRRARRRGTTFPNLTLVGIVDADLGLRGGDPRAAERTFQLLTQVSGRAGRHSRPGRALVQTWTPDHPVMQAIAAGDRDAFVAIELAEREAAGLPPFGRLAASDRLRDVDGGAGRGARSYTWPQVAPNASGRRGLRSGRRAARAGARQAAQAVPGPSRAFRGPAGLSRGVAGAA